MYGYSTDTLMLYARQNRALPTARACVPATTVPSFRSLDAARPLVAFLCSPCARWPLLGARCDLGHASGLGKHAPLHVRTDRFLGAPSLGPVPFHCPQTDRVVGMMGVV